MISKDAIIMAIACTLATTDDRWHSCELIDDVQTRYQDQSHIWPTIPGWVAFAIIRSYHGSRDAEGGVHTRVLYPT